MKSETMRYTLAAAAAVVIMAIMLIPEVAAAANAAGSMPYSPGLDKFKTSLGGEVAGALITVGIVAGGYMWMSGGEMSGMMSYVVKLIIVISLMAGGGTALLTMIGVTGAVI